MVDELAVKINILYLLILAHLVADYLLQFPWLIKKKNEQPSFTIVHGVIIFLVYNASIVYYWDSIWLGAVVVLSVTHIVVDLLKIEAVKLLRHRRFEIGIIDQLLHYGFIFWVWKMVLARIKPVWGINLILPQSVNNILLYLIATIFIIKPSRSFINGLLEKIPLTPLDKRYLTRAKQWILLADLERLVFLFLIFLGQWTMVGLIVLARSIVYARGHKTGALSDFFMVQILADVLISTVVGLSMRGLTFSGIL